MEASSLKTLYIYYTTGWQQRSPAVVLLCSRKRGSNFFALKTLHIYYTTQIALQSSERLNDALHLLYPRPKGVVSAPERLSGAPLVSYHWLAIIEF